MVARHSSARNLFLCLTITVAMTLLFRPCLSAADEFISLQVGENASQHLSTGTSDEGNRLYAEGYRLYQSHTAEDLREAFTDFERARQLCSAAGDHHCGELSLTFLGLISHDLGEYDQAQLYFRQGFAVASGLQDLPEQARNLTNLSVVLMKIGNYGEAAQALERSLEIRRKLPNDLRGTALDLLNLGSLENILGDFPRAKQALQQALDLDRQQDDKAGQSAVLDELADTLMMTHEYHTALQYVEQALKLDNARGEALDLLKRAAIRRNLGDAQGAWSDLEGAAERFKAMHDQVGEAGALANLGILAEMIGSYRQALDYFQSALTLFGQADEPEHLWRIHRGIGACFWKLHQQDKAEQEYRLAVTIIEKMRSTAGSDRARISYFDTKEIVYGQYIELLFDDHKEVEALEIAEAGRSRAFADLLRSKEISARLERSTANAADMKQVAATLNSCILEYFSTGRGLAIWLVMPDGRIFSKLSIFDSQPGTAESKLATLITNLRETLGVTEWQVSRVRKASQPRERDAALATPDSSQPTSALTETSLHLYHVLIPPEIETHLPEQPGASLIIVPHEELFLLPFAMLEDEHGRMLIDRFRLSVSPSITVLGDTDKRHRARNCRGAIAPAEVLIMGNPQMPFFNGVQLNPLDGTKTEVTAIAEKFGAHALMQDNATEASFKREAPKKRIIHLATHGLANDANPMDSFIALAPSAGEDGLLTAGEVANLDLTADLVVLSACESGLGRVTGDGIVGLSRSFILAGADSVVVSLWKVDDDATASLMQEFYTRLTEKKNKAGALRDAMQSVRERSHDPYDWAAFVLIGEPQ